MRFRKVTAYKHRTPSAAVSKSNSVREGKGAGKLLSALTISSLMRFRTVTACKHRAPSAAVSENSVRKGRGEGRLCSGLATFLLDALQKRPQPASPGRHAAVCKSNSVRKGRGEERLLSALTTGRERQGRAGKARVREGCSAD
jgi:hypothetical protein